MQMFCLEDVHICMLVLKNKTATMFFLKKHFLVVKVVLVKTVKGIFLLVAIGLDDIKESA